MIRHKESILVEKIVIYLPHMYLHRKKNKHKPSSGNSKGILLLSFIQW